jgi:uncharacterized integral membrane protein
MTIRVEYMGCCTISHGLGWQAFGMHRSPCSLGQEVLMIISLILGLILSLAALVFALQNTQTVRISFLVWHVNGSLALLLIIFFFVGSLAGMLALLPGRIRSTLAMGRNSKELAELKIKLDECTGKLEKFEPMTNEKVKTTISGRVDPGRKR